MGHIVVERPCGEAEGFGEGGKDVHGLYDIVHRHPGAQRIGGGVDQVGRDRGDHMDPELIVPYGCSKRSGAPPTITRSVRDAVSRIELVL